MITSNAKIIVLVTRGKNESVDYASIHLFEDQSEAMAFCLNNKDHKRKYWTDAEIVSQGMEIELCQPDDE